MHARGTLTVRVLLFAGLRERRGAREVVVDLPPGSTAVGAFRALFPGATDGEARSLMFAVGQEYVDGARPLADGDELALIPPIGGG